MGLLAECPAVSVALATYNGAKHLREQLDSLANQTELPAELVISDDNSSDDTIRVAEKFGADAPFEVRVLPRHNQLGFSDNFLHAAEHCRSPLIMFCDQDDAWLPDKLASSRRQLQADNSLIVLHTLTLADDELKPIGALLQGIERTAVYQPLEIEPFLCGYGNTMMFRRELLELYPRTKRPPAAGHTLSHDTWMYTLAAALGRVSHLAENLILYRQHGGNLSNLDRRTRLQRLVDLATFDVRRHVDLVRFNGHMADLFGTVAKSESEWSGPASTAAERYRQREAAMELRVQTFTGTTIAKRYRSFLDLAASRWDEPLTTRKKLLPAAKDFLLGVLAMGKRIE